MKNSRTAIGLYGLPQLFEDDFPALLEALAGADARGISQVVLTDHVVMGERTDRYPYGRFPARPETPWYEPMVLLAAIAAATKHMRLATSVLIGPLRPAVLLAKQAATLDQISGGRLDLGLGTGWQREEYEAAGVPFAARGLRLEEQVRACRALWRENPARFVGETLRFENIHCRPAPVQRELPLWFGLAATDKNCARIAEFGAGWLPIRSDIETLTRGISKLHEAFARAGREPRELEVRAALPPVMKEKRPHLEATLEGAHALRAAGVTVVEVLPIMFCRRAGELPAVLEKIATFSPQRSAGGD